MVAIVILVTFGVLAPALRNGFVNWDDDKILLDNPAYRGLGWAQLRWMFTSLHQGHYQPLTWVTFGLDYLLWQMEPFGYHLTNLILHTANSVLFYVVSLRLLRLGLSGLSPHDEPRLQWAAGFAAVVFAIHPLRVESVVWITERRDVLSGFFYLATILCYLKAAMTPRADRVRRRWIVAAVTGFSLSLLSKATGMTLPILLLILDIYPLRRLGLAKVAWFGPGSRRVWIEKIPFLSLGLVAGVVALIAQREAGALRTLEIYGMLPRLAQAAYGITFYLWKTVLPVRLSPLYELRLDTQLSDWTFVMSGLVVLLVSAGLFAVRRRWPAGLALWMGYLMTLSPVLGMAQSGPQLVADRYSYLACLGWAVLAGAGLFCGWRRLRGGRAGPARLISTSLAGLFVGGLGILTWRQTEIWHDSEKLWRYTLALTPESGVAHNNLGTVLLDRQGKLEEATEHYRKAILADPRQAEPYNNLGAALTRKGQFAEAERYYRRALEIDPGYADAHNNLRHVMARNGRINRMSIDEAIEHNRKAILLAHFNLGYALAAKGELSRAAEHFRAALRMEPESQEAREVLARVLALQEKRARTWERVGKIQSPERSYSSTDATR